MTLCSTGSSLVQTTVVPALTRSVSGWIVISCGRPTCTTPLSTGADCEGVAHLGVPITFRLERPALVPVRAEVLAALEALCAPPEEPQPPAASAPSASASAAAERARRALWPVASIEETIPHRPVGAPGAPRLTASMSARHFLTGAELSAAELGALLDRALELKARAAVELARARGRAAWR